MSADASELGALADDILTIEARLVPKIKPIVAKAALNVKNAMRSDARKSRHFKQIAPTINYDLNETASGDNSVIEAEIGYDKGIGGAASLAGIAIFGTSKPGGGTIRDPVEVLNEEEANFVSFINQACDGLL